MNYFTIVMIFIFLFITLYLQIFKFFINNPYYWEGLTVVPLLLGANICLGIYTSLSIWYKLSDKTIYPANISGFGVIVTVIVNFLLIPSYGYKASAIATLICYSSMMTLSFVLGQRHYWVPYDLSKFFIYLAAGIIIYIISIPIDPLGNLSILEYGYHTLLLLSFLLIVFILENPFRKKYN